MITFDHHLVIYKTLLWHENVRKVLTLTVSDSPAGHVGVLQQFWTRVCQPTGSFMFPGFNLLSGLQNESDFLFVYSGITLILAVIKYKVNRSQSQRGIRALTSFKSRSEYFLNYCL